jgi:NAD(P)-dependent dehydrogenase (short-subunit alcohol dehydrogenase family)
MKEFGDRRVVVTGALSGIGRATALAFARAGARLLVCDVRVDSFSGLERELCAVGARSAQAYAVDVGVREQMAEFCRAVCCDGAPDVLVNNAGVGLAGGFLDTTLEDWDWIVNTNFWGVVHGCHYFAPKMVERGRGQIVNIASAAGFYNSDSMTAYGTTKYAVVGLSEALRAELAPLGVGVSVLCPGFIATPMAEHMRMRGVAYPESERQTVTNFYARRNYAPERVAREVLRATRKNSGLVPVTPEAWALYLLKRALPNLSRPLVDGAWRFLERFRIAARDS